jgi:Fe-S cluster biogenesis protein NfuA
VPQPTNLRASGEQIERLIEELRTAADPRVFRAVEQLLRIVTELYGAGLARILELVEADRPEIVRQLADDPLVASLFLVHGLHPDSLPDRLAGALAKVAPLLAAHGGGVELLDLDASAGAVLLRLTGSCDGCPSSSVTLQLAVAAATGDPLAVLRRARQAAPAPVEERCDLCADPIAPDHRHLVDTEARTLLCACRGCYLLFTSEGSGGVRFRAVPDRYVALLDGALAPAVWDALEIPVSVAFFFHNSSLGRVAAFYPGPAGATESLLTLEAWEELASSMPLLATMEPDVEALLVRAAPRRARAACFIVPIDACYELVGRLRQLWRGFDGGREANDALDEFFVRVEARAE